MQFDEAYFDQGLDRRNTQCEKWDDRGVMPPDGIPLWVADMDFPCAPGVMEAIRRRAQHPCFGYGSDAAAESCADALRAFWRRRHHLTLQAEQVLSLPCVITGLKTCVRAFTREGDSVAMFTPVYGPFYQSVLLNGRKVAAVPLAADAGGRYPMTLTGMEEALRGGARLILLCNPHNPLSRLWTKEELTALADLAERYDVKIVSDEIHADFVYAPGAFTPLLSIEKARERAVMLCAASKTFNLAGLQQAAAVIVNEEMRRKVQDSIAAGGITSGNAFALAATEAAYRTGDDWLDGLLSYLDGSRGLLADFVADRLPLARMAPAEATYLSWLDLKAFGFSCRELKERCYRQGVAFTMGDFFGPEGEGCLRVNFGCPRTQLIAGMERLLRALKEEK